MGERRGPEKVPDGFRYEAGGNRLVRVKGADEGLPEFIRPTEDPDGPPTVVYDPKRGCNGHYTASWEFVPHGVPEGWHFARGRLVPKEGAVEAKPETVVVPEAAPEQIVGTEEQPASIPLTGEEGKKNG